LGIECIAGVEGSSSGDAPGGLDAPSAARGWFNAPMQSPGVALAFDDDLGDASAKRLRELVAGGRTREALAWLDGVRHWDARAFYIDAAARWPDRPAWLDAWVAEAPGSAIPLLVRGAHAIQGAWALRGTDWEPRPGAETTVVQILRGADADLAHAAALDRTDPSAAMLMIRAARGLQLPLGERQERFQQLVSRDPTHRRGHTEMLRALSAKWGGSHDLMFQFARQTAGRAQAGSSLFGVIAEAHVERWLVADRDGADAGYWRRDDVVGEIRAAAAASVEHPGFPTTPLAVVDRSTFAFCFASMGDWAAARRQFQAMTVPYRWPWGMFGDPAQLLLDARQRALAAG
jgi:hypothetical protein